jgi:nicotinamidase-related amidase
MPLSTLDVKSALVVVDLQKGILSLPTVHPVGPIVASASRLAKAFRVRHLPVVLVNVTGGAPGRTEQPRRLGDMPADWADFATELDQHPEDHVVTKRTWGAFSATDLGEYLKRAGVTQVVLCGVATSIGVESTARQAHELGFHVTLAIDAMTDLNLDAHTNSVSRIFPRLGETGTTDEIIALLHPEPA